MLSFQVKKNAKGIPVLMEIAPRIAGAMAMFRSFGVNLPLLTIYEAFRLPVTILLPPSTYDVRIMDKAYSNRYEVKGLNYDTVYVDLDDTLVLRQQRVHTKLVRFLFQCFIANKQIVLVTRSEDDPNEVLRQIRLFGCSIGFRTRSSVMKSGFYATEGHLGGDKDEETRSEFS